MQSPIFESFNEDRSRSGLADQCINLYPEHTDGPKGPEISLLIDTPGLTLPLCTADSGPVRGFFVSNNGLMYLVSGNGFYEVGPNFSPLLRGTIGTSSGPVSMVESPTQIAFVDGNAMWCWNFVTNTLTKVAPSGLTNASNPTAICYQDGFGLINSSDNEVYQTAFNDLSTLLTGGTVNNAFIQGNPQKVVTMFDVKREVWIFKKDAVEVWINQGNPGFAFVALQGVYLPVGCAASASVARAGEGLMWLGRDEQGNGVVYQSSGYQYRPVTTHALAAMFATFSDVSDAIAYSYQSAGHYFYVLTFPSQDQTWAYDLVAKKWHQRAFFDNGAFGRERANCHAFYAGKHVVGDFENGNLYALDDDTNTDNGGVRRWLRSWRALPPSMPQGVPMAFDLLQILMETGITVPSGTNPQVMLRWSDDGGYTWVGPFDMPAGKIGETAWRVILNRLGSTKIGTGLDRVWEISGSDPINIKIIGADWEGGPS